MTDMFDIFISCQLKFSRLYNPLLIFFIKIPSIFIYMTVLGTRQKSFTELTYLSDIFVVSTTLWPVSQPYDILQMCDTYEMRYSFFCGGAKQKYEQIYIFNGYEHRLYNKSDQNHL